MISNKNPFMSSIFTRFYQIYCAVLSRCKISQAYDFNYQSIAAQQIGFPRKPAEYHAFFYPIFPIWWYKFEVIPSKLRIIEFAGMPAGLFHLFSQIIFTDCFRRSFSQIIPANHCRKRNPKPPPGRTRIRGA